MEIQFIARLLPALPISKMEEKFAVVSRLGETTA